MTCMDDKNRPSLASLAWPIAKVSDSGSFRIGILRVTEVENLPPETELRSISGDRLLVMSQDIGRTTGSQTDNLFRFGV